MRLTGTLTAILLAAACATNPSPVPVVGPAPDLRALAGEWSGEYHSDETGRSGLITFRLAAGRDTAFGDVLMVPREQLPAARDEAGMPPPGSRQAAPQVLTINFVRVGGRIITGTLNAYKSPDCGCELTTTFRGELRGDRITGTFQTWHSDRCTDPQTGTWWAKRTRTAVAPVPQR